MIFEPGPLTPIGDEVLAWCDPLVVNEAEATGLLGWEVRGAGSARRAVRELRERARSVVVTVGAEGAYWIDAGGEGHVAAPIPARSWTPPAPVTPSSGRWRCSSPAVPRVEEAVVVGVRAGTFAVQSPGAQSSYPSPGTSGWSRRARDPGVVTGSDAGAMRACEAPPWLSPALTSPGPPAFTGRGQLRAQQRAATVAASTRARVLDAVARLDYRPNAIASALRGGSTQTVGLLTPNRSNPFFGELAEAVEQRSASRATWR